MELWESPVALLLGQIEYRTPIVVVLVVLCALGVMGPVFRAGRRVLDWLGARPWVGAGVVAGVALVISGAVAMRRGVPVPRVHDEFAYLLAADTFAHGRLTNPTHPMWVFFESIHIIHEPTYQGKYPPGQGMVLALGQVVFGHPVAGVWLLQALAAAGFVYALRPVLRPRWAMLGAFFCALHPLVVLWGQRYWGGSLALLGGALVLGGFARVYKAAGRSAARDAAAMALGCGILALSRQYEGSCVVALLGVALLWRLARQREAPVLAALGRVLGPAVAVLVPVMAFVGYYNFRVTGSALRLPTPHHHAKYDPVPIFVVQKRTPTPVYNHRELERFHTDLQIDRYAAREWRWELVPQAWAGLADELYNRSVGAVGDLPNPAWVGLPMKSRTFEGWRATERQDQKQLERLGEMEAKGEKLNKKQKFTLRRLRWRRWVPKELPFIAIVAALAVPAALRRDRWVRLGWFVLLPLSVVMMLPTYMKPHYAAPAGAVVCAVMLLLLRRVNTWRVGRRRWRVGRFLARSAIVVFLASAISASVGFARSSQERWAVRRQQIQKQLDATEGRHLVIVRYDEDRRTQAEWVYNDADIDAAKVVWAREMGPEKMRELLNYFKEHRVWLLRADVEEARPEAYALPATRATPE